MNKILEAREQRANHIEELMKEYKFKTVIVLKKNIMGTQKNPPQMMFICKYFNRIVLSRFEKKLITYGQVPSADGDYCFYVVDEVGALVKERTIEIEEINSLGRLIDIDVYNQRSISRRDLACEMRKCLICDDFAHVCARNKTHSEEELFKEVTRIIQEFLLENLTNITIKAIYSELELYPKFGLVSHRDSGCHTDMDYETFVKSAFAIKKAIQEYIEEGFEDVINPQKLQRIGLRAEEKMFKATNGVNTHKGLIFLLGVFLPAGIKAITQSENLAFLTNQVQAISSSIIGDYYEVISQKTELSNSDVIFIKHGIKGVRGEALNGLQLIYNIPTINNQSDDIDNHDYLFHLMSELDDTTIIHKNNIETLEQVKKDMSDVLSKGGYLNNSILVKQLSDEYKAKNISPGGSADMLVIKIIYESLKYLLE